MLGFVPIKQILLFNLIILPMLSQTCINNVNNKKIEKTHSSLVRFITVALGDFHATLIQK